MFTERCLGEGTKSLNPLLLFIEAVEPNFLVRVGIGKAFKKGRQAFEVKVDCTDKRGNWIKGCRSRGQQGT
jgi:hypothetical protein